MTRREWIAAAVAATSAPKAEELVIEASTGRVVHTDFARAHREPVGSLVKVFTALAYAARHEYRYPKAIICRGESTGCWFAAGHGSVDLVNAIAHSCNSYFLELARGVTQQDASQVAASYRIAPPVVDSAEARIGLGLGWLETPEAIALAYLTLIRRRQEPGVPPIVEGLRQCARQGTAKVCGKGVLAKTGTSVCVHRRKMPGDGWAIALFPEDSPRYAVLVREHGVPGATAANRLTAHFRRASARAASIGRTFKA